MHAQREQRGWIVQLVKGGKHQPVAPTGAFNPPNSASEPVMLTYRLPSEPADPASHPARMVITLMTVPTVLWPVTTRRAAQPQQERRSERKEHVVEQSKPSADHRLADLEPLQLLVDAAEAVPLGALLGERFYQQDARDAQHTCM